MTIKEVGVIDSLAFFIGIMFEFPSGIISDKLGRKFTLTLSQGFQFAGALIITLATTGFQIGLGFIIFQLGVALFSGTIESFGYEASVQAKQDYDKVLIKASTISTFSYLISLLIGGFIYTINNNLPNVLWTINYLLGFLCSLFIISIPKVISVDEVKTGYRTLFNSLNLKAICYLVFFLSICFAFDYGFLKLVLLDKFSDLSNNYIYIVLGSLLGMGFSNYLIAKNWDLLKTLRFGYLSLSTLFLVSYLWNQLEVLIFFVLSFLVIFSNQLFLKYINNKVSDGERAGVISFFSFIYKFPYVVLALFLGLSLESQDIIVSVWYLGLFMVAAYVLVKIGAKLRYNRLFEKGA
jgi:MFS family permease